MIPFFIEGAYDTSILVRRFVLMISVKFYRIRKERARVIDINDGVKQITVESGETFPREMSF